MTRVSHQPHIARSPTTITEAGDSVTISSPTLIAYAPRPQPHARGPTPHDIYQEAGDILCRSVDSSCREEGSRVFLKILYYCFLSLASASVDSRRSRSVPISPTIPRAHDLAGPRLSRSPTIPLPHDLAAPRSRCPTISLPHDLAAPDAGLGAAGYEVEDWANNDLGVAVGWWTKGREEEVDSEEERKEAVQKELRERSSGPAPAASSRSCPELSLLGGALQRALRSVEAERTCEVLRALKKLAPKVASLRHSTLPKVVGKLRKSANPKIAEIAKEVVAKWKLIIAAEAPKKKRPRNSEQTAPEPP